MSKPHGKKAPKKASASRRAPAFITSLHVQHPADLRVIKKAAKLRDESVSKFLLAAGAKEAARVLDGNCPTCGAPFAGHKKSAA